MAEALRSGRAVAAYLNSPAARDLDGAACGEALAAIGAIASGLAAAISLAREIAGWTGRIGDQELRQQADQILLDAAQGLRSADGRL